MMQIHQITHVMYKDKTVRMAEARLKEDKNYFEVTVLLADGTRQFPGIYVFEKCNNPVPINEKNLMGLKVPWSEMRNHYYAKDKEEAEAKV